LIRITELAKITRRIDPATLFFVGLFRPWIGIGFALFVCALVQAQWLPISVSAVNPVYTFSALAFLAGFSERFARDIAGSAGQKMGVQAPAGAAPPMKSP
jgi:hypothetical protein